MNIILHIIEALFILLFYNVIINKKIFKNFRCVLESIVCCIIAISVFDKSDMSPIIISIILIVISSLIVSRVDNRNFNVCLSLCIIGECIFSIYEYLIIFCQKIFVHILGYNNNKCFLALFILGLICIIISIYNLMIKYNFNMAKYIEEYNIINIVLVNIIFILSFNRLIYDNLYNNKGLLMEFSIFSFIILCVNLYFCLLTCKKYKLKNKEDIQTNINPLINNLVENLRAKEHEYKNHLNTLYALVQVSKPEDVKRKVIEYVGEVNSEESLNKLLRVDNSVIKAVLYSKVIEAEKRGYNFNYEITTELDKNNLTETETTVILSNLINNAFEAIEKCEEKYVELIIEEDDGQDIIEVKNSVENLQEKDLEKIFKRGISSKGSNRGYGLYNIKNIVEKHQGIIQPYLEDNILIITIIFP